MTQMSIQNVVIAPGVLNINLFGDGYAWAVELTLTGIGDLTDATIEAVFKPTNAVATEFEVTRTGPNDLLSKFSIGYNDTVEGHYRISIAKPGGSARSYVRGQVYVTKDPTL